MTHMLVVIAEEVIVIPHALMGCLQSKAKIEPEPPMTVLEQPDAPPPTDPRLPLDARQVFRIKKSWKGIKRKLTEAGVELFVGFVIFLILIHRKHITYRSVILD